MAVGTWKFGSPRRSELGYNKKLGQTRAVGFKQTISPKI
jgi:hypothetical protein